MFGTIPKAPAAVIAVCIAAVVFLRPGFMTPPELSAKSVVNRSLDVAMFLGLVTERVR